MRKANLLAAAIAAGVPLVSQASLLGDQVQIQWMSPDATTVYGFQAVTVAAGPELLCESLQQYQPCVFGGYDDGTIAFDIDASSVGMVFSGGSTTALVQPFNGPRFADLDFGTPIGAVSLTTTIAGLDASRVAFGADWVSVNLSGLLLDSLNGPVSWRIELSASGGGGTEVPAPPVLGLLAMGMAGLGMARAVRRRS